MSRFFSAKMRKKTEKQKNKNGKEDVPATAFNLIKNHCDMITLSYYTLHIAAHIDYAIHEMHYYYFHFISTHRLQTMGNKKPIYRLFG